MSRVPLSLHIPDASRFARALAQSLQQRQLAGQALPSHVELLNLLARALGLRNLQSLQAQARLRPAAPPPPPLLSEHARRALGLFDTLGRLQQWPARRSVQQLVLWPLWMRFEAKRVYSEAEVNAVLKAAHAFGDHATLRRELVNARLLERTPDCREYRKCTPRPGDEARALMQAWRALQQQA